MFGIGEILVAAAFIGVGRIWGAIANSKKSNNGIVKY